MMTNNPREYLSQKDLCIRCLNGIDDDHDGNCLACHALSEDDAKKMRISVLESLVKGIRDQEMIAFGEDFHLRYMRKRLADVQEMIKTGRRYTDFPLEQYEQLLLENYGLHVTVRQMSNRIIDKARISLSMMPLTLSKVSTSSKEGDARCNFCNGPMPCYCPKPADWKEPTEKELKWQQP